MQPIINIVLPTFIVIIIGFIFGKVKKLNIAAISDITIYIGLPALVFTSMLEKQIILDDALKVWASSFFIMIGCFLVAFTIFKLFRKKHSGLYLPITFMNTVNIPFPIIFLAFGTQGLIAATLFYIPNGLLIYTWGISQASKKPLKQSIKEALKIPLIYAAILALVLNLLRIPVHDLIIQPLEFIGMMAIPLVLLILGYNLSKIKINDHFPTTLLASFLRMGIGFLLGFAAVFLFNLTGIFRSVVILDAAMPAAVFSSVLATKYKNEANLVSSTVFLTTVISLITIPLLLMFLS
jgi:hypothetical protein